MKEEELKIIPKVVLKGNLSIKKEEKEKDINKKVV
jgi:hypothetical protein